MAIIRAMKHASASRQCDFLIHDAFVQLTGTRRVYNPYFYLETRYISINLSLSKFVFNIFSSPGKKLDTLSHGVVLISINFQFLCYILPTAIYI